MKILRQSEKSLIDYLGFQNYFKEHVYLDSNYVQKIHLSDNVVIYFNYLTGEMVQFDNDCVSTEWLVKHWFMFDSYIDQYTVAQLAREYLYRNNNRTQKNQPTDNNSYVILTTTACNARCNYCYEKGAEIKTMDYDTANSVADYIIRNSKGQVNLSWFGGEPLCNTKVIDTITQKLYDNNIPFSSYITTNGLLFDTIGINKLKYKWNMRGAQISFDGDEELHNNTKQFVSNIENPYQHILNTIEVLVKNKFKISIRLNLTDTNLDSLMRVVDDINVDSMKNSEFLCVYIGFVVKEGIDTKKQFNDAQKLFSYIYDNGFYTKNDLEYDYMTPQHFCMAESGNSIVVNPDGKFTCCERMVGTKFIGDSVNGVTDSSYVDTWRELRSSNRNKLCEKCKYMPFCKLLTKCGGFSSCTDEYLKYREIQCEKMCIKFYEDFLEDLR